MHKNVNTFKFPRKQLSGANPSHVKHLRWGVVIFSDLPPEGKNFQLAYYQLLK
jgi:hypothetical protein